MTAETPPAVSALTRASRLLAARDADVVQEWLPEDVPATVRAEELADHFVDHVAGMAPRDRRRILEAVETVMREGDQASREVMATGFLEALLADADQGRIDLNLLLPDMGPESRGYCKAWDESTGSDSGVEW